MKSERSPVDSIVKAKQKDANTFIRASANQYTQARMQKRCCNIQKYSIECAL